MRVVMAVTRVIIKPMGLEREVMMVGGRSLQLIARLLLN